MALPLRLPWDMAQDLWAMSLNPVINSPLSTPVILKNVSLVAGQNIINHKLGRNLQGWIPVRLRASATMYDKQDSNQTPQLTLVIVASAPVVADLMVF